MISLWYQLISIFKIMLISLIFICDFLNWKRRLLNQQTCQVRVTTVNWTLYVILSIEQGCQLNTT